MFWQSPPSRPTARPLPRAARYFVLICAASSAAGCAVAPPPPAVSSAELTYAPAPVALPAMEPTPPIAQVTEPAPAPPRLAWVLPVDHGVRADRAGGGQFLAPRTHGRHNGVDLLAPLGTPVLAACAGEARAGVMGGYGKFVALVCELPEAWGGAHLSLFYSHLGAQELGTKPVQVTLGQKLGEVGKTGNAAGPSVMPHLHLELIVHASAEQARRETHSGRDQTNNPAADALQAALAERCLTPLGLSSRHPLRRERRLDPYLVLGCLGAAKPAYQRAAGELKHASYPWHDFYQARGGDPDSVLFRAESSKPETRVAGWLVSESQGLRAGTP